MLIAATLLVGVVLALLAVPLTLTFRLAWPDRAGNDVRLGWAFGLVSTRIKASEGKPEPAPRPGQAKRAKRRLNPLPALRQAPVRRRLTRFIRDLWRAVSKDDLALRLRLGLGDPAATGELWGLLGPLSGWLASRPKAAIVLEPDFVDQTVEVDSHGRIRVIPLQLIGLVLGLLLSPVAWRGWRAMRAAR